MTASSRAASPTVSPLSPRLHGKLPEGCLGGATLWIEGVWSPATSGTTFVTASPGDGEALAAIAEAGPDDVDRAVCAAHRAAPAWAALDASERGRLLGRVASLLRERSQLFGFVETLDSGRTLADTLNSAARAAAMFEYYGGMADKIHGHLPPSAPGRTSLVEREPYGVVGAIVPWNYPLGNAVAKLGPILACGNAVVLKPAEQTPLVTLLLGPLLQEAGLPDGVVNILTGAGEAGAALVRHPLVSKISFTGSTETGRRIASEAGGLLKGVVLELGGKSPMIVFEDADLDRAAAAAVFTTFMNGGQTCTSCNRVIVARGVKERFARLCEEKLSALPIGDPLDPASRVGAIVSRDQLARMSALTAGVRSRPLDLPRFRPTEN